MLHKNYRRIAESNIAILLVCLYPPTAQGQEGSEKSCGNGKVTCHSLAVCTADDSGKKQCRCKEGYSGNGLDSCKGKESRC